jgi:ABC-2 type transport system permease protein
MIPIIARHEFLKLFKTGKIWQLLALCQFILGLIFYWLMEEFLFKKQQFLLENNGSFGITEEVIHPLFAWAGLLSFFITPLLATNSLTQERKTHSLELYLTAPISTTEIIIGKFIGMFLGQTFLLLPVLLMPMLIVLQDRIDVGQFLSGLFGLTLLVGTHLSIGTFIASYSKEPLVAALAIFITLLSLTLLEWMVRFLTPSLQWITELALLYHCKNLLSGLINSKDIIYYGFVSFTFLYFSVVRLNKEPYFKKKL